MRGEAVDTDVCRGQARYDSIHPLLPRGCSLAGTQERRPGRCKSGLELWLWISGGIISITSISDYRASRPPCSQRAGRRTRGAGRGGARTCPGGVPRPRPVHGMPRGAPSRAQPSPVLRGAAELVRVKGQRGCLPYRRHNTTALSWCRPGSRWSQSHTYTAIRHAKSPAVTPASSQ